MTIEEKAKAYDEALEIAKTVLETDLHESGVWAITKIFPELRESEDERIIEQIKFAVMQMPSDREDTKKECLAWLEKQKINTEGDFGRGYDCDYKACLNSHGAEFFEKQKEQKPAEWSEEDEKQIAQIERIVKNAGCAKMLQEKIHNWLKSLPERFNLQPKAEWSEEDEEKRDDIVKIIEYSTTIPAYGKTGILKLSKEYKKELTDWLKSLRPQPHWESSEEQMKALLNAEGLLRKYRHIAIASKLAELYEELKKLGVKEEPEYYQHFDPDC